MTSPPSEPSQRKPGPPPAHWRPSIASVLIFGFGVLVVVAVGAVMLVVLGTARDSTMELLGQQANTAVSSVVDSVYRLSDSSLKASAFVGELIARGELDPQDRVHLENVLMGALAGRPEVTAIGYVDPEFSSTFVGRKDGQIIRQSAELRDSKILRDLFAGTRSADTGDWFEIIWVPEIKAPNAAIAVPITRKDSDLGAMVSLISLRALSADLARFDQEFGTNSFILYGRDHVLAHPDLATGYPGSSAEYPLPTLDQFQDKVLGAIWHPAIYDSTEVSLAEDIEARIVQGTNEEQIFIYQRIDAIGPEPVYVGVHWPESEAGLELERLKWAGIIALVILMIAVGLAFLLGRTLARPILRLSEASRAIGNLDLRDVKPLGGSAYRELDSAAEAYNAMLSGLRWFEAYVPRTLVLRLMRLGEGALGSEERQVTVMFTDIVGFTAMSSRLSAGEVAEILNQHFGLITSEIEAHGGTVDKFIGDAVMAYWGAPEPQPDQASLACRTALAIAEDFARDFAGREPGLKLRIGLHSGPAVVGNIGAPGRVNYTLIGDTVNTAQRLEGLGKKYMDADDPSGAVTILISAATAEALEPGFNLEPVGRHRLVGRDEETEVLRLTPQGDR
ncbi:MAG: adenylate/guanylate cyclase domain-containing protein [Pseudomonadota bacterium]